MKKIILIFVCLTLISAASWAKDYHLVQTYIADDETTNTAVLAVYVLVLPDNSSRAIVFKTFDTQKMEAWLSSLPRESFVHYDANGFMPPVESAKLEALKTCCQKKGVSFVESNVN